MVSVDIYVNETTRHADVILPVPRALQKPHYDLALLQLALRNVANWSEPVLPLDEGQPDEWEVLAKLALIAAGHGARRRPGGRRRPHLRRRSPSTLADDGRRRRRGDRAPRARPGSST